MILDAAEAQSAFNARHGHAEWTADETIANIRAALTAKTNGSRTSTTFALRNRIVRQIYDEAATREATELKAKEAVNTVGVAPVLLKEGEVSVGMRMGDAADESAEDTAALDALTPMGPDIDLASIPLDDDAYWEKECPDPTERDRAKTEIRAALASLNDGQGKLFDSEPGLFRNLPPDIAEFRIPLKEGTTPQRAPMRRFRVDEIEEMKRQLTKMLKLGIVEVASSPWNAGIILARKPDGTWRLTIDLRLLNNVTAESGYKTFPLRRTDDILHQCQGAELFTLPAGGLHEHGLNTPTTRLGRQQN